MQFDAMTSPATRSADSVTGTASLLTDMTALAITGQDAEPFLQGQFCNDLSSLQSDGIQLNGYCNPKGRLLALFYLIRREPGFTLILPTTEVSAFQKRLTMFVLRADVTITVEPETLVLGLSGDTGNSFSEASLPDTPGTGRSSGSVWVGQLPTTNGEWLVAGDRQAISDLVDTLPDGTASVTPDRWLAARLAAGEPSVRGDAAGQFVPQMLNLDLVDGLSFSKGCYPGQEIVARTRYLGKQKRRMLVYAIEGTHLGGSIAPGMPVHVDETTVAGEVLAVGQTDTDTVVAVVLRLEHHGKTLAMEVDSCRVALKPLAMPYDPLDGTSASTPQ